MASSGHDKTLRDYLRVLRQQRLIILLTVMLALAAGVAYVLLREPVYKASASIDFRDPSRDLGLLGNSATPELQPEKAASANAETVTTPENVQRVKTALRTRETVESLTKRVSVHVEPGSNLVSIEAEANSADRAALLANTFARETQKAATIAERRRFATSAKALQGRLDLLERRAKRRAKAASTQTTPDPSASADASTRAAYQDRISLLESLAAVARPVQLVDTAQPPSAPSTPKPLRDIPLALFLGLIVGGVGAFFRDSLDRRLHTPEEITELVDLPMLGQLRNGALGRTGVANGSNPTLELQDLEAFRILRTNLALLDVDRPPRSVVVTSALPQEGKSTVAASLAWASAASGRRTLLVECDLRRPVLADRLGLQPAPGLIDYLAGRATAQQVLQSARFDEPSLRSGKHARRNGHLSGAAAVPPDNRGNFSCITAGSASPRPAELLSSQRFQKFVGDVSSVYDTIIFDSSPLLSVVDTLHLIPRLDAVVVCVRASQTTRDQLREVAAALDRFPDRPTGLVVTGLRPSDSSLYGYSYYAS